MPDIRWNFAASNGGREFGINDPGMQTFRDNFYRYLAREMIQNSLDARLDPNKPVHIAFQLEDVNKSELPDLAGLRLAITRCMEFWASQSTAVKTLQRALDSLDGRTVKCLRVSDFNTRGVGGGDGDRNGDWYNLVRSAGSSSKGAGEGGSFGIGKNAPFAASDARTVFYSTRTEKSIAFQGVALLASHETTEGITVQPTGFLGHFDGSALRERAIVPERFQRQAQGTDIWIIGYPKSENWETDLLFSVLDSFWLAIEFGDLTVSVGDFQINQGNLRSKLLEFSTHADFTGHIYHDVYSNPLVNDVVEIAGLGTCSIYLKSDEALSTKRVVMIRKTGMVITQRQFRSPMPFSGVFICSDEIGNKRLREMEPPRHDEWSIDLPEPGAGKKIFDAIGSSVRLSLKKLAPADGVLEMAIPGLERFLPDPSVDNATGLWNGATGGKKSESGVATAEVSKLRPIATKQQKLKLEDSDPSSPAGNERGIDDDEETSGEKSREPGEGGKRAKNEGDGEGEHSKNATRPKSPLPIRYRTFIADEVSGRYNLTITPELSSEEAFLSAFAIGDDSRSLIGIKSARLNNGDQIGVKNGVVGPIALVSNASLTLELFLEERARYALEVVANEAE